MKLQRMRHSFNTGRRRIMGGLAAAPAVASLQGCAALFESITGCPADPAESGPVTWIPDVAHPVFWGVHDLSTADGAPRDMMIYYPAYKFRAPPILKLCFARWPVVLFLHGQVVGAPITGFHRRWWRLPSTLARCGYVVVVPNHNPGIQAPPAAVQAAMRDLDWVRNEWSESNWVDKRPTSITVAGHSNGSLVAAAVAAAHPELGALVSWGGHHPNPPDNFELLRTVTVPSFYMWTKRNTLEDLDGLWEALASPTKYAAMYEGEHFDYLDELDISGVPRGPCPHMPGVAADLAALFISSNVASLTRIPVDLTIPKVQLTAEQEIYAGGNLMSFDQVNNHPGCRIDLRWNVNGVSGSRRLGPT